MNTWFHSHHSSFRVVVVAVAVLHVGGYLGSVVVVFYNRVGLHSNMLDWLFLGNLSVALFVYTKRRNI
jgi:hypothetical protein